jgi:hypothetical protein
MGEIDMKTLISIVSEQTIPNILFILEQSDVSRFIFLTTPQMEMKAKIDAIVRTARIAEKSIQKLIVPAAKTDKIQEELDKLQFSDDEDIFVNITCGTKMMSLCVFNYFKERGCKIFYLEIGQNSYIKIFPLPARQNKISIRLSLKEYFSAHDIQINFDNHVYGDLNMALKFLMGIYDRYVEEIGFLVKLQNNKIIKKRFEKKHIINIEEIRKFYDQEMQVSNQPLFKFENISALLQEMNINAGEIHAKDIHYITGRWFEEMLYLKIKQKIKDDTSSLGTGITIKKKDTENELDIALMYNNELHIIECKTRLPKDLLKETIYKQAALAREFGLSVKAYLFVMQKIEEDAYIKRAAMHNIVLLDRTIIEDNELLEKHFFSKILAPEVN